MRTPEKIQNLVLMATCVNISVEQHDEYMKDCTQACKKIINRHVRQHMPELYDSLGLNFYNPFTYYKKSGMFVLRHSGIEYFLKYT